MDEVYYIKTLEFVFKVMWKGDKYRSKTEDVEVSECGIKEGKT